MDETNATRTRRRSRRVRSAGQALVEFGLIAPVFFLIFFGIIEFALLTASIGSFNFAARDAARLGAIKGRTDPNVDSEVVAVVRGHVSGIVMAKGQEIDIYRADPLSGTCLDTGNNVVAVGSASCEMETCQFSATPNCQGTWAVDSRDDSQATADYLGVRVIYQYTFLTGFVAGLGSNLNLSTYSVQRIEPQDFGRTSQATPRGARADGGIA
jgi:Flp pilus assembly protein TadG